MTSSSTLARWCALAALLALASPSSHAARILGVLPYGGYSHFASFQPLLLELARRGHEVTVLCPFDAPKDAAPTYKVLSMKGYNSVSTDASLNAEEVYQKASSTSGVLFLEVLSQEMCSTGLRHPAVGELLKTKDEFDLIFVEVFSSDCFLGFTHRFKAPVIGLSSHALLPWAEERMGNPPSLAFASNLFFGLSDRMTLIERIRNTIEYAYSSAYFKMYEMKKQDLVKEVFGEDCPATSELAKNTSLIFVNSHETVHPARPLVPSIINVAGMHLPKRQPLDKDLEAFIAGAAEGIIYFNTGSLLRGESLPQAKTDALLKAFSQLKQRVIWKWEGKPPSNAPPNVLFKPWLRQFDVLQHPKTRLFISHGGMLGTAEAVHSGVPVLSIPMFGDQPYNTAGLESRGAARRFSYLDLDNVDKILEAIRDVLENPRYAENAKKNAAAFRDRPLPPLDTAVFWSEYVIRHKGAPYFRAASVDMPFYQLMMLDVILVFITPILVLIWAVRTCCKRFSGCCGGKQKRD